jgi:HTH-type transcriptional regulator/antitoxin HigA
MRIQPIRTDEQHQDAVARIRQLIGSRPGSQESDELEVLATLVDAYESRHFPMEAPDPITLIKFQMEQRGLSRKDLEPLIGSRARVSEVLSGKRSLTLPMIRRLHAGLAIPVDLLVGVTPPHRSTARVKKKLPTHALPTGRQTSRTGRTS